MTDKSEIAEKFWKQLKSDRTIMLGLEKESAAEMQPMTAILEDDEEGPAWIFTAKDVSLVEAMTGADDAVAQFVSKGHDLFASCGGTLTKCNDPAMIDKLWNPYIAAWFEGGKDDPKLQLLRLDIAHAQIWLNENSLFAGVKLLFGADPKEEYKDKVAEVDFQTS